METKPEHLKDKFELYNIEYTTIPFQTRIIHLKVGPMKPACGSVYHNGVMTENKKDVTCHLCLKKGK